MAWLAYDQALRRYHQVHEDFEKCMRRHPLGLHLYEVCIWHRPGADFPEGSVVRRMSSGYAVATMSEWEDGDPGNPPWVDNRPVMIEPENSFSESEIEQAIQLIES